MQKPPEDSPAVFRLITAGGISAVIFAGTIIVAAGGGELLSGEGDPGEELAGILRTAAAGGIAAFLGGDGVIQHRHDQLGIPLQTDDGELAQCDEQTALIAGDHQVLVEHLPDVCRDLHDLVAPAVADVADLGSKNHGIQHLHH